MINYLPLLQRYDKQRIHLQRKHCVTDDLVFRLSLIGELKGHTGCVNCLQWNQSGTLLASGSDDYKVILWDAFSQKKLHTLSTGHTNNIFSIQFASQSDDRLLITGAGDGKVNVHDVMSTSDANLQSYGCHFSRVKRVVTHPAVANVFWSGAEDGLVMQFDLREPAQCQEYCSHALINLNAHLGPDSEVKCLAISPLQPELLAVGANDHYVRLIDRRMISTKRIKLHSNQDRMFWDRSSILSLSLADVDYNFPEGSAQYFIAGHLPVKQSDMRRRYRPLTSTYLTFSPCGRDLLVNLGGEQIYLFNLYEKKRSLLSDFRKYFAQNSSSSQSHGDVTANQSQINGIKNGHYTANGCVNGTTNQILAKFVQSLSNRDFSNLQLNAQKTPMSSRAEMLRTKANGFYENANFNMAVAYYSEAVHLAPHSPILYCNRAAAYIKREWDGDIYAALIDCYTALILDPNNLKANFRLVKCLFDLKQYDTSEKCLEIFKARYPEQVITHTCVAFTNKLHKAMSESDARMPKRKRTVSDNNTESIVQNVMSSQNPNNNDQFENSVASGATGPRRQPDILDTTSNTDASFENSFYDFYENKSNHFSVQEMHLRESAFDYDQRFCGHCNTTTDIKEANFFGSNGEYIVGGSDDGKFFIWDRKTCNIVRALVGDDSIVNCLQPHPTQCLLASSGIDVTVKLWAPRAEDGSVDSRDVPDQANAAMANQRRMNADPLEVMLLNMGYRLSGMMDHSAGSATDRDYNMAGAVQCHPS